MPADLEFTVACAWAELMRLEEAKAPAWKRNAQRRRAKALTRRFSLSRRGDDVVVSMPQRQVAIAAE